MRGTVYVVDDDASIRKALERMLRTMEFAVETFESPAAFLEHAVDVPPCCAVLDVRMPGIDGLALQERLRDAGRRLPIIFLTGYGDVSTSVRAMKTGAIDFMEKPCDGTTLVAAIRRALEASRIAERSRGARAALEQKLATLTPRENQVFLLVTQGLLNKVAAARIGVAEKTVKVHRARVMEKMNAGSLAELVLIAERLGLAH